MASHGIDAQARLAGAASDPMVLRPCLDRIVAPRRSTVPRAIDASDFENRVAGIGENQAVSHGNTTALR
jgi:hypothetical protein